MKDLSMKAISVAITLIAFVIYMLLTLVMVLLLIPIWALGSLNKGVAQMINWLEERM